MSPTSDRVDRAIDRSLVLLAVGRIGLGLLARLAPTKTARAFGATRAISPELDYMNRVFGARAIALGAGYLLSAGGPRRLWQRLALLCDTSDALASAGALSRSGGRGSARAQLALTGSYALVGTTKLATDLARATRAHRAERADGKGPEILVATSKHDRDQSKKPFSRSTSTSSATP